jgi:hypothetical protein
VRLEHHFNAKIMLNVSCIDLCIDKPGKSRDFYHSCYAMSGLSLSQHHVMNKNIVEVYTLKYM